MGRWAFGFALVAANLRALSPELEAELHKTAEALGLPDIAALEAKAKADAEALEAQAKRAAQVSAEEEQKAKFDPLTSPVKEPEGDEAVAVSVSPEGTLDEDVPAPASLQEHHAKHMVKHMHGAAQANRLKQLEKMRGPKVSLQELERLASEPGQASPELDAYYAAEDTWLHRPVENVPKTMLDHLASAQKGLKKWVIGHPSWGDADDTDDLRREASRGEAEAKAATKAAAATADAELAPADPVAPPAAESHRIPYTLFLTSAYPSLDHMGPKVQENVRAIINRNPGIKVTWFDNAACKQFLDKEFPVLGRLFKDAQHGPYKSDVCRTAYLYKHGGWYIDQDFDVRDTFLKIGNPETTFVSAWTAQHSEVLNAMLGATPGTKVLADAVAWLESKQGFKGCTSGFTTCGTLALKQGLNTFFLRCGTDMPTRTDGPVDSEACGESVRMLKEVDMADPVQREEVNQADKFLMEKAIEGRANVKNFRGRTNAEKHFRGLDYAILFQGSHKTPGFVVGYSRFDDCADWGCDQNPLGDQDPNIVIHRPTGKKASLLEMYQYASMGSATEHGLQHEFDHDHIPAEGEETQQQGSFAGLSFAQERARYYQERDY